MIKSQLRGRILSAAVLASRMIAQQDVLPGERTAFKRNVDVFRQTNNRRSMNRKLLRVKYMTVVLLHPRYSFEDHDDGAPLGAYVDGLKGGIKD